MEDGLWRRSLATALACLGLLAHAAESTAPAGPSGDTHLADRWVRQTADAAGRPYAIVDKKQARIHVFDGHGRPVGTSPVLIGLTPGDDPVSDLAGRAPESLAVHERTTPAGRFESQPGLNDKGESVVWIDYDAALAIHRLRPTPSVERRAARLASTTPKDNRASLGCIVVPVAFYEQVVATTLGRQRGVVYVLPEARPLTDLLATLDARARLD